MINEEYKILHTINEGAFAKIKLAEHITSGNHVAIKILKKKAGSKYVSIEKNIIREVTMLRCLNHPHIVKYIDLLEDNNAYYIIMEYIDGMQLFDKILQKPEHQSIPLTKSNNDSMEELIKMAENISTSSETIRLKHEEDPKKWFDNDERDKSISNLSQESVKKYFSQIVSALGHCHAKFISHRDIKLENILVDSKGNIKIVDFGLADFMKSKSKTFCGSMFYIAPEILKGEEGYSSIKSDIWSLGIVLYAMLTGKLPFGGKTEDAVSKKIIGGPLYIPACVDTEAANLISKMLIKNPTERITLTGIREHTWCRGYVLPLYLPEKLLNLDRPRFIDNKIIDKMVSMGYDDIDVIVAIRRNDPTECAVVYHALCEKYSVNIIIKDMMDEVPVESRIIRIIGRTISSPDLLDKSSSSKYKYGSPYHISNGDYIGNDSNKLHTSSESERDLLMTSSNGPIKNKFSRSKNASISLNTSCDVDNHRAAKIANIYGKDSESPELPRKGELQKSSGGDKLIKKSHHSSKRSHARKDNK